MSNRRGPDTINPISTEPGNKAARLQVFFLVRKTDNLIDTKVVLQICVSAATD